MSDDPIPPIVIPPEGDEPMPDGFGDDGGLGGDSGPTSPPPPPPDFGGK